VKASNLSAMLDCENMAAVFRYPLIETPGHTARRARSFRMDWEMGAIHAYRIPVPAWMLACNRQAAADCIGSA
jgi:hypothetical protein